MMLVAFVAAATVLAGAEPGWEEVANTGGVKVWARDVAGTRLRELKAEVVVATPPQRVLAVLEDLDHYTEFMPYTLEVRTLSRFAGGHIEYQRLKPPLVSNRDLTVRVEVKTDAATGRIERRWVEANDQAPPLPPDTVRVAVNHGEWILQPVAGGKTQVDYHLCADPGGTIPAWMANKANTTSIPDLLSAVRHRAEDPSWKRK